MATFGFSRRRSTHKVGGLTSLAVKMASRSPEIRPVAAWVEPATQYDCSAVVSDEFCVVSKCSPVYIKCGV